MNETRLTLDDLLRTAGEQLRGDFREIQESNPHAADRGAEAETILRDFLSNRLPKRFGVKSGVVVGNDGSGSRQSDVIIYDSLNSFVYRSGPKLHVLPRDNVAAVIEVKSKLNKAELEDAAKKIASVKSIKPSPISGIDQPVTFTDMIMTGTLGCVFAFDSYTSLETLADNCKEINAGQDSDHWIDLVVVLDKGCISYAYKRVFEKEFVAWQGGPSSEDFMVPPLYVHLVQAPFGENTLHHFFLQLMAHLTFFRKRSGMNFESLLKEKSLVQTIQGYQYNLHRQLVPVEKQHQCSSFQTPRIRFNLYLKKDRKFVGQICLLHWQDGAVITCSSLFSPQVLIEQCLRKLGLRSSILRGGDEGVNLWMSYVLPIAEQDFINVAQDIHAEIISVRDSEDGNLPPVSI